MKEVSDVIVIGAGAVGCAIARELSKKRLDVVVLEKSTDVASSTSGRNSAVVHGGFNNKPGSLMARLCVEGNRNFESLARELDVGYRKTGKVLIGFDEADSVTLHSLYEQGLENGCKGLRILDKDELESILPGIGGIEGLFSENTAIINPFHYTIALAENAHDNGVEFFFSSEVISVEKTSDFFILHTPQKEYKAKVVINASGLACAKVSAMFGVDSYRIYPCRGEYLILDVDDKNILPIPIYPAPKKGEGGLGVHLTPTMEGNIIIGPSAEYIIDSDDLSTTKEIMEKLEKEAKTLFPKVSAYPVIGSYSGIRPKQTKPGQGGYQDFVIKREENCPNLINLIGIESPGLTASYPIAKMVVNDILSKIIKLEDKNTFIPPRKREKPFREMTQEEREISIKRDPEWGDIICRCREVSKHEIRKALDNPLGVRTISGVKYRAWPTTGRCNGGYCLQKIVQMMVEEYKMEVNEIVYRNQESKMFTGRVK